MDTFAQSFDRAKLDRILENPLVTIRSRFFISDYFEEIDRFEKTITCLKSDREYSRFTILHEMVLFAQIYDKFRPMTITHNDWYFGTVKKMDAIYFNLCKFIGSELLFSFSNSFSNDLEIQFKAAKQPTHEDIAWDRLLDDIHEVSRAIKGTAEGKALELYFLLGEDVPYFVLDIIEHFIVDFNKNLTSEDVDFDTKSNCFLIHGEKIIADSIGSFKQKVLAAK